MSLLWLQKPGFALQVRRFLFVQISPFPFEMRFLGEHVCLNVCVMCYMRIEFVVTLTAPFFPDTTIVWLNIICVCLDMIYFK